MDLDQPIRYRGLDLNTVETLAGDGKRRGCVVEEADFGQVAGVGYVEKRAQADGNDASDVYLSARQVHLRGYLYGETRADAFDRLQNLRSALTPTGAYGEDPANKGYLPLEFDVPTNNLVDFDTGWKYMQMYARPRAQPVFRIRRDTGSGGQHNRGAAIEWAAELECKDPRIYLRTPVWEYFTASETGTLTNRGDYPAPIDVLLEVAAGTAYNGQVRFQIGAADLTITVPTSANARILRYSATLGGILTVEENGAEALRMDLLSTDSNANRLLARPGPNSYIITKTNWSGPYVLTANTRMMFNEAFA
jgi:hypothetical protein